MLVTLYACELAGLSGVPIEVEVHVAQGRAGAFDIVGLPDTALDEARLRVYTALKNSEFGYPFTKRIIVNLAPAHIRKIGTGYDMAIVAGIILADQKKKFKERVMMLGELSLDGHFRSVRGVLPITMAAKENGFEEIWLPKENAAEAGLVEGMRVLAVDDVAALWRFLSGERRIFSERRSDYLIPEDNNNHEVDFSDIKGHQVAKRALEIAAAGGHNLLMVGPPGSGKSMLAQSLASILPPLSHTEALEVTAIHSVSGFLSDARPYITRRPFRAPHHTGSTAALIGGGAVPKPGEITLAHNGVLFLDEIAEFPRSALEALRQPLENGRITITRARAAITYPADCSLIAACNPCPCGFLGDEKVSCECSLSQLRRYAMRLSGPFRDRMDMELTVPRVPFKELTSVESVESSEHIRERVILAREFSYTRKKPNKKTADSIHGISASKEAIKILREAADRYHLSARACNRVARVSRTIADLSGLQQVNAENIAEAVQYRLS